MERASQLAAIRAIVPFAWWTRFGPSYRSAKDRDSAVSPEVAGRRWGAPGVNGRERSKNIPPHPHVLRRR